MTNSRKTYLLLNGPNLNMLGTREPEIYGSTTLADIEEMVAARARELSVNIECFQSNHEGEIIDAIHGSQGKYAGIIFNPGAHTHYSYAIYDALMSVSVPTVEVHISNINSREAFRKKSVTKGACVAQIAGEGISGYNRALEGLVIEGWNERLIDKRAEEPADARDCDAPPSAAPEKNICAARLERVRCAMSHENLDAFYVRDTTNIAWITAFSGTFDSEQAHAFVITHESAELHTDSRYYNACKSAAQKQMCPITVACTREKHAEVLKRNWDYFCAEADADKLGKIGIEDSITLKDYSTILNAFNGEDGEDGKDGKDGKDGNDNHATQRTDAATLPAHANAPALIQTHNFISNLRAVKDEAEIAHLKAAQSITDAAFSYILTFMQPGKTEREVQLELDNFMLTHGAGGLAFQTIVAAGANAANPHAIPGNTRLEAGMCVVMDFGARVRGYCSDMTRTVFLGEPAGKMKHAWEVIRCANESVQAQLHAGVTGKSMHELAEKVLAEGGFEGCMGHGLGHGVGMDIHEEPCLNTRNSQPLSVGAVVTVEPGIYIAGKFGMRLEDFGVVRAGGFERFTQSTHEMVVL